MRGSGNLVGRLLQNLAGKIEEEVKTESIAKKA
jgi:hypothetical protein